MLTTKNGEFDVLEVSVLKGDELLRRRADCIIGSVAVCSEITPEYLEVTDVIANTPSNLAEAIESARNGDTVAEQMIRSNVTTDYLERAYKTGFVSEVTLEKSHDGDIVQYGQSIEDVHVNSLKYLENPKLRERAKVETLNAVRDRHYAGTGIFKDNARVTFSLVHEDMDEEEADDAGFFTHTRSLSIQLMTERDDGTLMVQSAFVAGRESLGDEVFDKESVVKMAEHLGVDYSGMTTEEILGSPLLIKKSLIPELVVSLVQKYDLAASQITGKTKFYGVDIESFQSKESYMLKVAQSKSIATRMKDDIDKNVQELQRFHLKTPGEATAKLAELNDKLLKKKIFEDRSIDSRVLGVEAAYRVNHARYLIDTGRQQHEDLAALQKFVNKVGSSSSCPGGSNSEKGGDPDSILDVFLQDVEDQDESADSKLEDCEFISKECPKCGEKNVKTECRDGKYYGACGCKSD